MKEEQFWAGLVFAGRKPGPVPKLQLDLYSRY